MATITQENARQIRDPMIVQFDMEISEDSRINTYTPTTAYKSWDNTLGNVWPMRVLADLQDEGFLLDGTAEWYEDKTASAEAGKLGLRSNEGDPVSIRLVGNKTIKNITIGTQGEGTITYGSTTIQATGRDFINVNAQTINLTFTPTIEHGRIMVEFIFPGMDFEIRNENLLKANVNLRCNLDPFATTLEASEIEIEMYYPYDLGDAFKYIGDDWPIYYTAGYSDQMSPVRTFYLSEQITWQDGVLTIHGVDAVPKLERTVKAGSMDMRTFDYLYSEGGFESGWRDEIKRAIGQLKGTPSASGYDQQSEFVREECSLRDILQRTMSLTASLPRNCRIYYVDAGIPTFESNEHYVRTWSVREEDLASISIVRYQNVSKIQTPSSDDRFDETLKKSYSAIYDDTSEVDAGQIFTSDHGGGLAWDSEALYSSGGTAQIPKISFTPSESTFKAGHRASAAVSRYRPLIRSGGVTSYANPNGLPGAVEEYDVFLVGRVISSSSINLFTPKNLFNVSRDTIEFDYKGDPRWQPHDILIITRLDGTTLTVRISTIEMTHEGGGTMAHVVCKFLTAQELQ